LCYTKKTENILTNTQILSFIRRYQKYLNQFRSRQFLATLSLATDSPEQKIADEKLSLKSVLFCGGEVFTLKNFPRLVNKLNSRGIFVSLITNSTIDRLKEIKDPKNCQLLVSFDGPKEIHDANRGTGNFDKSVKFVAHALKLGFPIEIFFLITQSSYPYKDSFNIFNLKKTYLTDRLGSLTPGQVKDIRQNYRCYPPKNFGCSVLSLQSDGKFYGCCESTKSIGSVSDPLDKIINNYLKITSQHPLCSDPAYFCNLKT
jgi:MoaA/NifB/PqqE/SkfB family radical SAM enzyme